MTGPLAGLSAGDHDVDGGVIRSPAIALLATGTLTLSTQWYLAHLDNASSADFFRIRVVGTTSVTVFQQPGAASNRAGAWSTASIIEAGVDDLTVTRRG